MKRTIKRTEIRIETVEITTIRRVPPDPEAAVAVGNDVDVPPLLLSVTAEPAERSQVNRKTEKR
jgi:hypothetical protein